MFSAMLQQLSAVCKHTGNARSLWFAVPGNEHIRRDGWLLKSAHVVSAARGLFFPHGFFYCRRRSYMPAGTIRLSIRALPNSGMQGLRLGPCGPAAHCLIFRFADGLPVAKPPARCGEEGPKNRTPRSRERMDLNSAVERQSGSRADVSLLRHSCPRPAMTKGERKIVIISNPSERLLYTDLRLLPCFSAILQWLLNSRLLQCACHA